MRAADRLLHHRDELGMGMDGLDTTPVGLGQIEPEGSGGMSRGHGDEICGSGLRGVVGWWWQ